MVVDGVSVHYEVQGSGPAVFLLHGWGSNLTLFDPVAEILATQYRVVRLDFPGCGTSSEPSQPWGMDEYVHFTASFISAICQAESSESDESGGTSAQPIIVLGHSHGGRVAIRLATDPGLPFTVTKMILVDSAGILPQRSLSYHVRVRSYKLGKAVLQWKPVATLFPDALARLQSTMGSTDYAAASPVMRGSLVKVVNADLQPLLPRVRAETLVVWGELDAETPVSDGRIMEREIPGSGLVVLPGAGHYSFLDQAYTFGKVLESFLQIG
ncbi:MAG: alpha/beta hydrolase [Propionibacteriaceae bacterium]|nr:alpha/beta hydrolase [Propionibacteriaceae bacterium]